MWPSTPFSFLFCKCDLEYESVGSGCGCECVRVCLHALYVLRRYGNTDVDLCILDYTSMNVYRLYNYTTWFKFR